MRFIKRLWGVRHIRYFYLSFLLARWVAYHQRLGMGFFAQQSDLDFLDRVWKGEE